MGGANRTITRVIRLLAVGALVAAPVAALAVPAADAKGKRPPSIRTLKPYGVSDTEAVLNSEVSPHGHEIVVRFQWGKTKRYGHITWVPEEDPYPYFQHQEDEEWIGGLRPNTIYHYRVVASFDGKRIYGNDVKFKTQRR
jgi:hypothetical protein